MDPYLPKLQYSFIKPHFSTDLYSFSQFLEHVRKELPLGCYFWSEHVKLENRLFLSLTSHPSAALCLLESSRSRGR